MCYHVATPEKVKLQQLADEQQLRLYNTYEQYFHVSAFERPFLPVRLNEAPGQIQPARWKLLPHWVDNETQAAKYALTFNAEDSRLFETASYKPYAASRHGLLYVEGFYEPHKVEGVRQSENYFIYKPDRKIFTLGIIYAPWVNKETGEAYNSFSVVTVKANPLLAEIHNEKKRMPLILPEGAAEDWLHTTTKAGTQSFFQPYDGILKAHKTVRVTAARGRNTNLPSIQDPVD